MNKEMDWGGFGKVLAEIKALSDDQLRLVSLVHIRDNVSLKRALALVKGGKT